MRMYRITIQYGVAEIWVTRQAEEAALQEQVRRLTGEGYRVVIYRSGRDDLAGVTGDLLKANLC